MKQSTQVLAAHEGFLRWWGGEPRRLEGSSDCSKENCGDGEGRCGEPCKQLPPLYLPLHRGKFQEAAAHNSTVSVC